jgi:penicillin amidase
MIRLVRLHSALATALLVFLPLLPAEGQWADSARARLAQLDGELRVAGLDSAVEVRRDRWGIPHIYAKTQHDLFFAQGLVAAQDRLWQIDMWRRIGEGRLSEVLGPKYLERDKFARLLKYRGDMAAEWASYAPDTRAIVTAFVAGLNAYVRTVRERPPVEYGILGFQPEPFADDVPLQRMAALSMTGNATLEVARAQLVAKLGAEKAAELWPPDPYRPFDPAPGLDLSTITNASLGATAESYGGVRYPRLDGSNNWVVSGALTASGKPLLANDPHRTIANPSLRYVSHLVGPGWNVIGAGEPAVPGVAGGHNERIAFGFTIVGMDQQDVYVEQVGACPSAPRRRCVRQGNAWQPLRVIVDTIPVKGETPRIVRLEFTSHGPIVAEDSAAGRAYVIRFVGSEPGTAGYLAQISINRASDWTSFKAAASRWKLPTENLVYADVDGNIGWVAAGLMPVRSWSGMLPVPGDGRYEWQGFLPFEQLPMSLNPPSGFIATANNNILPQGYDKPLNYEWASAYRFNRLVETLSARKGWTREDFQRLQHDEVSLPARELVPLLLDAAGRHAPAHPEILGLFRGWDLAMRKDASAPVVFLLWTDSLLTRYYRARAGEDGLALLQVDGPDLPSMIKALRAPDASFGSDPAASRDRLLVESFDAAATVAVARFGANPGAWRYGSVHGAQFHHPLARAFDLPDASRGGDGWTVNMTGGPDFRQSSGASWREVIDLADWDNSVGTSVPGQSGQPGSPFYGNLLPMWEKGEYFPLLYSRPAVERETAHVLWLRPAK